ncbi:MAG: dihydroorotate dehydrogenase-like protein [Bacteroidales bacterium]|nr:dihydroorotate dehydrogenase-like protein [Bacteroidales bacterium]
MVNLQTEYLGLKLKNPIIVASSGLSSSLNSIKKLAHDGAGAIVLKSLFEEQILAEAAQNISLDQSYGTDVHDYITEHMRSSKLSDYTTLIRNAKAEIDIPIIASINCITDREWTSFTKEIEDAGADALELNIGVLPSDDEISSAENEEKYFQILEKVRRSTNLPIAVKITTYSAGLANLIKKISWSGFVDGIVMFNKYFQPDIDIDKMDITTTGVFTTSADISTSLRWVAIMSSKIETPISATTGVHTGADVVKQILAGANNVQIASTLYKNGTEQIQVMLDDMTKWMEKNSYNNLEDYRGKMAFNNDANTIAFERIQFMKHYGSIE